ncbi:p23 chaperone protein wos2 [Ophidiomyces ophidiicola]|uniref:P23 chaperone protein wos2 n=1 Tax=Ophidiomyces ophidiicola TaxID=1387563 RepID=A0ACB8UP92_9EURO|nr:p23 chaperone protein wos2 [Ophidiomyces ophidiicola]KAI1906807.1 p23 chaperone protein wos2 [Ophidiomyces ophidiicola]KAI1921346.1 p23 chaperone protein wos2 [Ophidiomyces ophidiicola]KAI1938348.1 p23 chaperone protein wos2 [Ophidiomyces ophidiicola]KAI1948883.1 p23 chaperone protein wos2 [Ophidiomyces ophidiicola]
MANTQVPEVLWAQRSSSTEAAKNIVYLSLSVSDVPQSSAKLNLTATTVSFSGHSSTKNIDYKVDMELYGEIDVENSKTHHSARGVDMILRKKEHKEEYWPRLLKESKKVHFVKTDFDKWVDEDEQDEAPEEDFSMPGGFGGDGGLGGIDFSKLGGGQNIAELAGDAAAGDDGSDEDDDMPELEEEKTPGQASATPKIEELK